MYSASQLFILNAMSKINYNLHNRSCFIVSVQFKVCCHENFAL